MWATLTLGLWTSLASAGAPKTSYVLDVKDAKRVEAVLTYTTTYPNLKAKEWIIFAPQAPELTGQVNVKSRLEPAGTLVQEHSPLRRPVLMARALATAPGLEKSVPIQVTYEATLRSRHVRSLKADEQPPKVPAIPAAQLKAALAEHGDVNFSNPSFKKWLKGEKLAKNKDENDVDYARRVFLAIRGKFTYLYEGGMDRHASAVCQAGKSDCGGLSSLFVASLRSQGIPARMLIGRWAMSAQPNEKVAGFDYYQWHVKSEFFAQGVGWVPVDMSSGILHDKSKAGLAYFGHDPGDFFTMHLDNALEVDTIHFGKEKLHNLQSPAAWVTGGGNMKDGKTQQGWKVRVLE